MLLSMCTGTLASRFSDKEAIRLLKEAGFDAFDLTMCYGTPAEKMLSESSYLQYADELKEYAKEIGIICNQAHSPTPSRESGEYYDKIVRSIEVASRIGAKIIVVHPIKDEGDGYQWQKEALFEKNMAFYSSLIPHAEKNNIKIAVENVYSFDKRRNVVVSSVCSHSDEFSKYIDTLNSEYIVACVDMGHAALVSDTPSNLLAKLKHRVHALHVHDVDCVSDNHTLPYTRKLDWNDICKTLAEVDYKGDFTYEVRGFFSPYMEDDFIPVAVKFSEQVGRSLIRKIERAKSINR